MSEHGGEMKEKTLTHLGGGVDNRGWTVGIYRILGLERELCHCEGALAAYQITIMSHPDENYERTTHRYDMCRSCAESYLDNRGARIGFRRGASW